MNKSNIKLFVKQAIDQFIDKLFNFLDTIINIIKVFGVSFIAVSIITFLVLYLVIIGINSFKTLEPVVINTINNDTYITQCITNNHKNISVSIKNYQFETNGNIVYCLDCNKIYNFNKYIKIKNDIMKKTN